MMVVITYDVDHTDPKGASRLRRVAKLCERYGVRVQYSVFEMLLDPAQLTKLKTDLLDLIDPEADSIRIYRLGKKWESKVETLGADKGFSQDAPLLL
ncbi:MAG: CRISPR-associated endonuclease Cas2 [Oscillospiraceae bacterium]|nr:CRISPR-associated endonuclease Cas2 [Oscillospiraceae bacterium]